MVDQNHPDLIRGKLAQQKYYFIYDDLLLLVLFSLCSYFSLGTPIFPPILSRWVVQNGLQQWGKQYPLGESMDNQSIMEQNRLACGLN